MLYETLTNEVLLLLCAMSVAVALIFIALAVDGVGYQIELRRRIKEMDKAWQANSRKDKGNTSD